MISKTLTSNSICYGRFYKLLVVILSSFASENGFSSVEFASSKIGIPSPSLDYIWFLLFPLYIRCSSFFLHVICFHYVGLILLFPSSITIIISSLVYVPPYFSSLIVSPYWVMHNILEPINFEILVLQQFCSSQLILLVPQSLPPWSLRQ